MDRLIAAILIITGASGIDELEENIIERFEYYSEHPLELNSSGRSRLLSSGLVSAFQAASLIDYRSRCGDVLSYTELASVDGFGQKYAEALSLFTKLESSAPAGMPSGKGRPLSATLTSRVYHRSDKAHNPVGMKLNCSLGERLELNWASRTTYSEPVFGFGNGGVALYGIGHLGKLIVGDFNARFGQGLVAWNGFSLASHTTASSLSKNATGLSLAKSYSSSNRGAAVDCEFGKWILCGAGTIEGRYIFNATRLGLSSQFGCTVAGNAGMPSASIDWKVGFSGGSWFGEGAYDGLFRLLTGAFYVPGYGRKAGILVRYSPSDRLCAAAWSSHFSDISLEAVERNGTARFRGTALMKPEFSISGLSLHPVLRLDEKLTGPDTWILRSDVRCDLAAGCGPFSAQFRFNWVHCNESAWLWYAELGYAKAFSVYVRGGIFKADSWADRIYVYERGAPGAFNVPAYYGRGWTLSLFSGCRTKKRALYFRASALCYPGSEKSSVLEFRLQYSRFLRKGF